MDCICFPLDPVAPVSGLGFRKTDYFKTLYGSGDEPNPLTNELRAIRDLFAPDIAIMTSQNAFARRAFSGLPTLSMEYASLPRLSHPLRVSFDPSGHQIQSLLETHAGVIKTLPLTCTQRAHLLELLGTIKAQMLAADPRAPSACAALRAIRAEGPVALLVTQPPDYPTYEGSFKAIEVKELLCSWAESLPPSWIGVPTYHEAYQLDAAAEMTLARSCPRLRFLPRELSRGLSEPLLTCADGMITISSTTATTGLLLRKPTIVVGRSPYNAWCEQDPSHIADASPLSADEAARLLAFLCNRYSCLQDDLKADPETFIRIADATMRLPQPADWFMDFSEWSIGRALSLFNLTSRHAAATKGEPSDRRRARSKVDFQLELVKAELNRRTSEVNALRQELNERAAMFEAQLLALTSSSSWQMTEPLRRLAGRGSLRTRRNLRRAAQAAWWAITPWRIPARIRFIREQSARTRDAPFRNPASFAPAPTMAAGSSGAGPSVAQMSWPVAMRSLQFYMQFAGQWQKAWTGAMAGGRNAGTPRR
jgi:hypothetical protein